MGVSGAEFRILGCIFRMQVFEVWDTFRLYGIRV